MLYGPSNSIYLIPTHEGENTFLFKPLTPKSDYKPFFHISIAHETNMGSISVSGLLPTYPSPNPTLTLTCCQLTVVELREGWVGSCPDTRIDPKHGGHESNGNDITN